jgi:hypothetical protein
MDVSYYYQILDMGIVYEKGRKVGHHWKIGERKRLREEIMFWQNLLEYIEEEENGIECSDRLFKRLEELCHKYKFPNYDRILRHKNDLISSICVFERKHEEELIIRSLMKCLLLDLQKKLDIDKDKEKVYHLLVVLHNLPKSMHGPNVLNDSCNLVSYGDALLYAQRNMDATMKEKYDGHFPEDYDGVQ